MVQISLCIPFLFYLVRQSEKPCLHKTIKRPTVLGGVEVFGWFLRLNFDGDYALECR